MDRRRFLRGVGLGGLVTTFSAGVHAADATFPKPGLQLFTVMKLLDADFEGTLKAVSAIGYRTVETIGTFNRDAAQLRALLAKYRLTSPSQHLMPGNLYVDFSAFNRGELAGAELRRSWARAFDFEKVEAFTTVAIGQAKALGQKYIVWPLSWPRGGGIAQAKQFIAAFNRAGNLCRQAGLTFAVHNHDQEFAPVDGQRPYDLMIQETDPGAVHFELDFMWATTAGVDPVAYFERYPGRFRMTHLKDRTKDGRIAIPGTGVEDFHRLLTASEKAGIAYAFVEYDQPQDAMKEIRDAYAYLSRLRRD